MTIDQLIAAHWGTCDVQSGETPEDYASRHEEEIRQRILGWDVGAREAVVVCWPWGCVRDETWEVLYYQPDDFWRLKEPQ